MSSDDAGDQKDQHKYLKVKKGFQVPTVDPIQDVMNDEELSEAEKRIKSFIDSEEK